MSSMWNGAPTDEIPNISFQQIWSFVIKMFDWQFEAYRLRSIFRQLEPNLEEAHMFACFFNEYIQAYHSKEVFEQVQQEWERAYYMVLNYRASEKARRARL